MALIWDPRMLLGVDPDGPFTCVGTTQKGGRCRYRVNQADRRRASRLLDRMATLSPRQSGSELGTLASLTLCVNYHRQPGYSQIESMIQTWWNMITRNYPEVISPAPTISTIQQLGLGDMGWDSRSTRSVASRSILPSPPPSPPAASSIFSPTPSTAERRALAAAAAERRARAAIAAEGRATIAPPTPTTQARPATARSGSTTVVASSTSGSPSTPTSRPITPPMRTPPRSPVSPPSRAGSGRRSPSIPAASSTVTASSSRAMPSTIRSPRPTTPNVSNQPVSPCPRHTLRKPLEECPVCMTDICCADDAIWCRAQCGNNVHRRCFAPWVRERMSQEAVVTCMWCRARWKFEWED